MVSSSSFKVSLTTVMLIFWVVTPGAKVSVPPARE